MLVLAFLGPTAFGAPLDRTEIIDLFSQGKELFRQANQTRDPQQASELYGKAVLRFERIVREGEIQNGKLFYNIGNAYFRMDDLGRAILNYRRAEQFIPNDVNLNQNLAYARQRRVDNFEEPPEKRVLKTLFFWHHDLSARARSILFGAAFVLLWVALATRLFFRRPFLIWIVSLSALTAALFLSSLLVEMVSTGSNPSGVILAEEVIARKGDSQTYEPSFKEPLHRGTEFLLIENRTDWLYVELPDGRRCWLPAEAVELIAIYGVRGQRLAVASRPPAATPLWLEDVDGAGWWHCQTAHS